MVTLHHGDCLDVMAGMDPESVDAVVTDPPYGLGFMGKAWDKPGAFVERKARRAADGFDGIGGNHHPASTADVARTRLSEGVKSQAWHQQWAEAAYRVAKPSAYLLAFGGTRTVHRLTTAIEDAGWIIRDMLVWAYASGFPKSKASLKPAWEPIVMARKPGPLRELAIDACRIGIEPDERSVIDRRSGSDDGQRDGIYHDGVGLRPPGERFTSHEAGRWPANVLLTAPIFDGGWDGVVGGGASESGIAVQRNGGGGRIFDNPGHLPLVDGGYTDSGTYSRFFLVPKADRADREPVLGGLPVDGPRVLNSGSSGRTLRDGEWVETHSEPRKRANSHPTVKPTDLMRHLVRLVTPTGGTVLDPFLGSGSTAIAAEMEGFDWIGIEKEREYCDIAEARLNGTQRGLGLDSPAPTPKPRHASIENTTAKRASYGRHAFGGLTTGRFGGHPPIGEPSSVGSPVDSVDLQLFAGMAGPAEGDEGLPA